MKKSIKQFLPFIPLILAAIAIIVSISSCSMSSKSTGNVSSYTFSPSSYTKGTLSSPYMVEKVVLIRVCKKGSYYKLYLRDLLSPDKTIRRIRFKENNGFYTVGDIIR